MTKEAIATSEDKIRYMIIIPKTTHEKLCVVSKAHQVTQSELIETLISEMEPEKFAETFAAIREAKVNARTSKRAVLQKLGKLSQEQLVALAAISSL